MNERFHKELVRGSLDVLVLSALAEQAKYGYLIQKHVRDSTGGKAALTAGTLYPLLHRLEAQKLVRSYWDESTGRKRKWYELTSAGHKRLKHQAEEWLEYAECIRRLLALEWKSA